MTLVLVTPPSVDPVTLEEARNHLRLDAEGSPATHADDDLVQALITGLTKRLDGSAGILGRALCTQTWDLFLDEFPCLTTQDLQKGKTKADIKVPLPPLQHVEFIRYVDADGVEQTLSPTLYQVAGAGNGDARARIVPAPSQSWPSTRSQPEAVRVRFTAGYLDNSSPGDTQAGVPGNIKLGLKAALSWLYENRGDTSEDIPKQVLALLPAPITMFG
jgi:uncharacterized phiE125 gp8 family phage protein